MIPSSGCVSVDLRFLRNPPSVNSKSLQQTRQPIPFAYSGVKGWRALELVQTLSPICVRNYWDKIGVSTLCPFDTSWITLLFDTRLLFQPHNKSWVQHYVDPETIVLSDIVIFMVAGTGIFGAFFLLLLIVADLIPQAMTVIPKCGIYISCNLLLVVFSLLFNTLITSIHNTGDDKPMCKCLRPVSTYILPCLSVFEMKPNLILVFADSHV